MPALKGECEKGRKGEKAKRGATRARRGTSMHRSTKQNERKGILVGKNPKNGLTLGQRKET